MNFEKIQFSHQNILKFIIFPLLNCVLFFVIGIYYIVMNSSCNFHTFPNLCNFHTFPYQLIIHSLYRLIHLFLREGMSPHFENQKILIYSVC